MTEFYPFFLIIFAGVFFSMAFRRIHVPWVVGLIFSGILLGPYVFNVLQITPTADFFGELGLIFLMFMAGLETRASAFSGFKGKLIFLAAINGLIPFVVGMTLMMMFGYSTMAALFIGIIFLSSSIAVVIPSLERYKLIDTKLGQSVIITTVLQDIASLVLLSVLLQNITPITWLPLYIFYPLVLGILILSRYAIPKMVNFFISGLKADEDLFQQRFRAIFLILIGMVIVFELLGLHPIIAGFFTGLVLSESLEGTELIEKIRTISYGIFIPTFFVIVGSQTDITVLLRSPETISLVVAIVLGSLISKFVSGFFGARLVGFPTSHATLFGVSSIPQLSTTLAVAFSALSFGLLDEQLITAIVILSVVTVLVSPSLLNLLGDRIRKNLKWHEKRV